MAKSFNEYICEPLEIVGESDKALQVQVWTGAGSDPSVNAKTLWIPKSQCKTRSQNPTEVSAPEFVYSIARWWVYQNKLYGVI